MATPVVMITTIMVLVMAVVVVMMVMRMMLVMNWCLDSWRSRGPLLEPPDLIALASWAHALRQRSLLPAPWHPETSKEERPSSSL